MTLSIRIGTNPIAWSNDDKQELGGATPLDVCLNEARSAGYSGIELGNKFPRDAAALAPIMTAHDLQIVSGWYSSNLLERDVNAEIEALEPHLGLLEAMGSKVVVWCETTGCVHGREDTAVTDRPVIPEDKWDMFCERLSAMGAHVASRGMKLAYHHHMGTVIETASEIDRMMAGCSSDVWLLLDTGHLTFAGADPVAVASQYVDRIAHIHCKDVRSDVMARAKAGNWSFLKAVIEGVFTVPGDGSVDFQPVINKACSAGYEGWLVVEAEQDPAKAHPLTYAKLGYRNLAGYARSAGYEIVE